MVFQSVVSSLSESTKIDQKKEFGGEVCLWRWCSFSVWSRLRVALKCAAKLLGDVDSGYERTIP